MMYEELIASILGKLDDINDKLDVLNDSYELLNKRGERDFEERGDELWL